MIAGHTGWEPEMIEANKSPGVILAMIIPVKIQLVRFPNCIVYKVEVRDPD